MKIVIVGMGIQGKKRKNILGKDFLYSVDKYKKNDFKTIYDVPLEKYDSVFVCLPDREKFKVVKYCIENKKHVLLEKPFILSDTKLFFKLQNEARKKKVVCYTAYNHRFEPSFIKMKQLIKSKKLGNIYRCRIFYGNGTSLLVKKSRWRDKGNGVLIDIGSHLLDICIYWFGKKISSFKIIESNKFENKSPDYATIILKINKIKIMLEMTLCMWKNTFTCDVIASKGSAHINSLCKWSNNTFNYRKRKFPSGNPQEKTISFKKGDPTWKLELLHFKNLIKKKTITSFKKDITLNNIFLRLNKFIS